MDHPGPPQNPLGWTFPGYPSMVQLDGHWAMDQSGTLPETRLPLILRLPRETLSAILTYVLFARNYDSEYDRRSCQANHKNSASEPVENFSKTLPRSPIHVIRSICRTFRCIVDELSFWYLTISTLLAITTPSTILIKTAKKRDVARG